MQPDTISIHTGGCAVTDAKSYWYHRCQTNTISVESFSFQLLARQSRAQPSLLHFRTGYNKLSKCKSLTSTQLLRNIYYESPCMQENLEYTMKRDGSAYPNSVTLNTWGRKHSNKSQRDMLMVTYGKDYSNPFSCCSSGTVCNPPFKLNLTLEQTVLYNNLPTLSVL